MTPEENTFSKSLALEIAQLLSSANVIKFSMDVNTANVDIVLNEEDVNLDTLKALDADIAELGKKYS